MKEPLVKTCFSLFTHIVHISTRKHCWHQEYLMEYSTKYHLVENCFQQYTNLVDEST